LILDPGHGGEDTGAVGCGGLFESDINLEIVRRLSVLLRRGGALVEMTREDDRQVSLEDRIQRISRSGADLFLSVHNNSVPSYENPLEISGPRSFFYHGHGVVLAKRVLGGLAEETGFPWQSTNVRFHVFRPMRCCPQMPGALAEVLFLSNPEDEILLLQPAFLDNACHGLYKGVLAFVKRQPLPLIPAGAAPGVDENGTDNTDAGELGIGN
jgi:N-acetylmuramoyl-L-alanine amidase